MGRREGHWRDGWNKSDGDAKGEDTTAADTWVGEKVGHDLFKNVIPYKIIEISMYFSLLLLLSKGIYNT